MIRHSLLGSEEPREQFLLFGDGGVGFRDTQEEHCLSLGFSPSVLWLALRHPSAAGGKPGGLHFTQLIVRECLGEPYGDGE